MSVVSFIASQRTEHQVPLAVSCRALDVSESWFDTWSDPDREPSPTRQRRDRLDDAIRSVFEANDGEYGSPRVHAELIEQPGWVLLSVNTVAERLAALGLRGQPKRVRRSLTKTGEHAPKFENLRKAGLQPASAERGVVRRHRRGQDLGRQALRRHRDRSVLPPADRVRDRRSLQGQPRVRRVDDGNRGPRR